MDEPLPTEEQLGKIITRTMSDAQDKPQDGILQRAISALSGLAAFPAEQATAMSLDGKWNGKKPGLDVAELG